MRYSCSSHHHCDGRVSRRDFLATFSAATAGLLVGGPRRVLTGSPVSGAARVAVAKASTYDRAVVRNTMETLFDALGGLGDLIRPGDTVGLKINLTGGIWNAVNYEQRSGLAPEEAYWTHPEVLRAVGELARDAGAGTLYVLEATTDDWMGFAPYGYVDAASSVGASYVNLNDAAPFSGFAVRPVDEHALIYETITQNGVLDELDCLISLAKSKQHANAGVTHGMKNLVGTIPMSHYNGGNANRREEIHQNESHDGDPESNLCRIFLDINGASPLQLVVNDAVRTVMGGEGPWHALTPVTFDTFVASKDPVAADVVATQILGLDPAAAKGSPTFPQSLNYLQLAAELGRGTADLAQIDVVQAQPVGVERPGVPPVEEALAAHPNPFGTEVALEVSLSHRAYATLVVYDVTGRRLCTLAARSLPAGRTTVVWDGTDAGGRRVPSGLYLVVLTCNGRNVTRKVARVD